MTRTNEFGQPIGEDLVDWSPPPWPPVQSLVGTHVELVPLDPATHASPLFESFEPASDATWTYMSFGPFADASDLERTLVSLTLLDGWQPYTIEVSGLAVGIASYLRIDPLNGAIEIGSLAFSPALQRTTAATEALYLLIKNCFDLGYRRCEWKCDDLNAPSHSAARRLGFRYEGVFRRATHYKGRSRDTAWYAIIDEDWPALRKGFDLWLSSANFDAKGVQVTDLASLLQRAE